MLKIEPQNQTFFDLLKNTNSQIKSKKEKKKKKNFFFAIIHDMKRLFCVFQILFSYLKNENSIALLNLKCKR